MNRKAVLLTLGVTLGSLLILSLAGVLLKVSTSSENRLKEAALFETVHLVTDSFQRAYGRLMLDTFKIDIETSKNTIQLAQLMPRYEEVSDEEYKKYDSVTNIPAQLSTYTSQRWPGLTFQQQTYTDLRGTPDDQEIVYILASPISLSYAFLDIGSSDSKLYANLQNLVRPLGTGTTNTPLEETPIMIFLMNEPFLADGGGFITLNITTPEPITEKDRAGISWGVDQANKGAEKFDLNVIYTSTAMAETWKETRPVSFTPTSGTVAEAIWLNGTEKNVAMDKDPVILLTTIAVDEAPYQKALIIASFRTNMTVQVHINFTQKQPIKSVFYSNDTYAYNSGGYGVIRTGKIRVWPW